MARPPSLSAAPLAVPPLGNDEAVRRRTTRSTAGHHSNLHNLPRPANEVAQAGPSAVQVLCLLSLDRGLIVEIL